MSETDDTGGVRRAPTWMKIALGLSLLANVAVLGVVGGAALHWHGKDRGPGIWRLLRAMPDAQQSAFREEMRDLRGDWRAYRRGQREAVESLAVALAAEPYAPAAVEAAVDRFTTPLGGMLGEARTKFLAQVAGMTPAERLEFAEGLRRSRDRRGD